jgi:hypothetical protein
MILGLEMNFKNILTLAIIIVILYLLLSRKYSPIVYFKTKKITPEQKQKFLYLSNSVRNKCNKNIRKLEWDDELAEYAAKTATHLANNRFCSLIHSPSYDEINAGENLAWTKGMPDPIRAGINGWAGEGYGENATGSMTGHYTAMNWSNVSKIGCGIANSSCGTVISCNYKSPDGQLPPNTLGHYNTMVKCTKPISV